MDNRTHFTTEELQERALADWQKHAKTYRELVPTYERLLEEKRFLKKTVRGCKSMTLDRVKASVINELIKIPLFDLEHESEAQEYIGNLTEGELIHLVAQIHMALESYQFKTIASKIWDFNYQIEHCRVKKCKFGFDPEYAKSSSPKSTTGGRKTKPGSSRNES